MSDRHIRFRHIRSAVCRMVTVVVVSGPVTAAGEESGAVAKRSAPPSQSPTLAVPIGSIPKDVSKGATIRAEVPCGPRVPLASLAFSEDGKTLWVGGYGEVLAWDLQQARLARRLGAGALEGSIQALCPVGKGPLLAVGHGRPQRKCSLALIDTQNGKIIASFDEPEDSILALSVSPDGSLLVGACADHKVYVWDLEARKLDYTITGHHGRVVGAAFDTDGKQLATADGQGVVTVWDPADWSRKQTWTHPDAAQAIAFVPGTPMVVVAIGGPNEWAVRVRRVDNPRFVRALPTGPGMPLAVACSADGQWTYVGCSDQTIKAFDRRGRLRRSVAGHDSWVYAISLCPDGRRLASCGADGAVRLWSTRDGHLLATLAQLTPGDDGWLAYTPHGYLATSVDRNRLAWKGAANLSAERLAAALCQPGRVRQAVLGEKVEGPDLN